MYFLIILWLIFLFVYLGFNVYGISRVLAMRIKGDATGKIVLFYLIVMMAIIFITVMIIFNLDWGRDISNFFRR